METQIVAATIAVLTGLMALGIILAYRAHRKRRKPQEQRDDVTLHVKLNNPPAQQAIPRPPKVVRAPEGCAAYLTAGREYRVKDLDGYFDEWGSFFTILNDRGNITYTSELDSSHLNGGDWIVVEREGEEREKPSIEQQLFEAQAEATRLAGELEAEKQKHEDYKKEAIDIMQLRVEETAAVEKQRNEARDTITVLTAERDNFRELWEKKGEQFKEQFDLRLKAEGQLMVAQYERDEFRSTVILLSELLDKAHEDLRTIHAQASAEYKKLQAEGYFSGKHTPRDERGRFVKSAEVHAKIDGNEPLFKQQIGRVERPPVRPQTAKPLRLVTDLGENDCIHCPTEREAEAICKLMHEAGLKWASGKSLLEYNKWADEKEKTVYYPSRSSYGSILYAQENGRTIHPASDFLPPDFYEHKGTEAERPDDSEPGEQAQPATTEPAIDWTKPVAFPEGYEVPKGTRVIKIGEDDVWVKKDSVGVVVETSNDPIVKWENKDYDLRGSKCDWAQPSYFLAPENPADHPNHPEFGGKEKSVS